MRAPRVVSPAVRAVVAVAAASLFIVLVAWATLIGPDQVFTGPGPSPGPATTTTQSCIPLPVVTHPDGSTSIPVPEDVDERDYCDPPGASMDQYRDLVEDHQPPFWLKALAWVFLITVLVVIVTGLLWLVVTAARAAFASRREPERQAVAFDALSEPGRVAEQVVGDADEQDTLLRDGDARNAIVATWHRFEVQGARAGVARTPSETSSEYALRILDLAEADPVPVTRLAELYREARFSDHPITEEHRSEALVALAGIRRSLGARA